MSVEKQQNNLEFINNVMKSKKYFYNTEGEDYRISDSPVFFNDDVWDFNYLNENDRRMDLYRFNFANVPSQFRSISKHLVIQELFLKKNRFGSVSNTFNITKDFFFHMDRSFLLWRSPALSIGLYYANFSPRVSCSSK